MIVPFVDEVVRVNELGVVVDPVAYTLPWILLESRVGHVPSVLMYVRYSSFVFIGVFEGTVKVKVCVLFAPCGTS